MNGSKRFQLNKYNVKSAIKAGLTALLGIAAAKFSIALTEIKIAWADFFPVVQESLTTAVTETFSEGFALLGGGAVLVFKLAEKFMNDYSKNTYK